MAIVKGLFEGFTGKLGNTVGYNLKGKQVIRRIGKCNKPATPAQLAVRQKVAVVNTFLKSVVPLINIGYQFEIVGTGKNPYNAALSYHTKQATQGNYPNIAMDYSKILISKGTLEPAINPLATLTGNELSMTWSVPPDMAWDIKNDRSMLLICCPEMNSSIYFLSAARRCTGKENVELPPNYLDKELHIYIAFTARKSVSDSVYIWI